MEILGHNRSQCFLRLGGSTHKPGAEGQIQWCSWAIKGAENANNALSIPSGRNLYSRRATDSPLFLPLGRSPGLGNSIFIGQS
jgi:hypothetical protein